jgi:GTP cyclohydrolase IB
MQDIQSSPDHRNVPLERVGISRLALPVQILEQGGGYQHVVAEASMFVEVPADIRGTHMSRFVEILHEWVDKPVSSVDLESLLRTVRLRAGSYSAEVKLSFRYFMEKTAPVSGKAGLVDYVCGFLGRLTADGFRFRLSVGVPITTLCPCSKAIARHGAHNQRAISSVGVDCVSDAFVWLEDLIRLVENQASCGVFSVLKREDEKWVTEAAYENPRFVEDVTRDVVLALCAIPGVARFTVQTESIESIHNHNAFASIGWVDAKAYANGASSMASEFAQSG